MSLLECLLFEIEKSGGIAKLYEVESQELTSTKTDYTEDLMSLAKYKSILRKGAQVLDIKTGRVYRSVSELARSENLKVRNLQINLKSGSYKSFVKVA